VRVKVAASRIARGAPALGDVAKIEDWRPDPPCVAPGGWLALRVRAHVAESTGTHDFIVGAIYEEGPADEIGSDCGPLKRDWGCGTILSGRSQCHRQEVALNFQLPVPGIYRFWVHAGWIREDNVVIPTDQDFEYALCAGQCPRDRCFGIDAPPEVRAEPGGDVRIPARIANACGYRAVSRVTAELEGQRARLIVWLDPGQQLPVTFVLKAPAAPGAYTAVLRAVNYFTWQEDGRREVRVIVGAPSPSPSPSPPAIPSPPPRPRRADVYAVALAAAISAAVAAGR
jgi:hypothetical protein